MNIYESNGSANIFVTNTSQTDYAFIAEISVTVNGTWTRYFYDDFTVGGRMIPPGLGQSKLTVSLPAGAKCTAEVHYWVADTVATGSN
nr:hypothetical protein [uncultured Fluviicola sp.]